MSAITSAGSSGLFQYFSNVGNSSSSAPVDGPQQATQAGPDGSVAAQSGSTPSVGGHPHHHHRGGGGLFSKIQSAVTSALQNAKTDGSTDINQTIKDAITQALKDIKGGKSASGTPSVNDPDGDGDDDSQPSQATAGATGAGATTASAGNAAQSAFFQTLQQYGIDPQQFRQDFLSAIQSLRGDSTSGSNAEDNKGVLVDTTA